MVRRAHGYFIGESVDGHRFEADSLQCPHCGGHFMVQPKQDPATLGRFCTTCMAQCCGKPACETCVPFLKAIERMEARARLRASLGMLVLSVLLASPVWADPPTCSDGQPPAVTRPAKGDTRAKCGEAEVGLRDNPDGSRDELSRGRSLRTLGLVKTWNAKRLGPQPAPDGVAIPVETPEAPLVAPAQADTPVVVDVGVFYTPRAEAEGGGTDRMLALIALAASLANESYANVGVNLQLRLRHVARVDYVEGAPTTDLSRFRTPNDGVMDTVHADRDRYGLDVLTLIGDGWVGQGTCGLGYLMSGNSTGFASSAFNLVDRTCAGGYLSYPHEVGHNMGLNHDPANAGCATCYGYAYGHNGQTFRTVMSYGGQTRIRAFSTPHQTYNGEPLGIAGQRDNAQRLRDTMATVASFRAEVPVAPTPTPPPPPPPSDPNVYQASVDFSGTQGHRGWWYRDGGGGLLVWDTTLPQWKHASGWPRSKAVDQHPGDLAAVRRWVAPESGSVTIEGLLADVAADGGDGVQATIRHNGVSLWTHTLAANNTTGVTFSLTRTVTAGDTVDFIIDKRVSWSFDWTKFDPTITLTPGEPPPPPPFTLGTRETIMTAAQRSSLGLTTWPDGLLSVQRLHNGAYTFTAAQGGATAGTTKPVRATGTLTTPASVGSFGSVVSSTQGLPYLAGGPVYRDPTTGMQLMVLHGETWFTAASTPFTSHLSLAKSIDCGATWTDLGRIVAPQDATVQHDIGGGPLVVIGGYFYVYFRDVLTTGPVALAVARAPVTEVVAAAVTGTVVPWSKYHDGGWTQPGLGGLSSPLESGQPNTGWFDVKWSAHTQTFWAIGVDRSTAPFSLYAQQSADGLTWTPRLPLIADADGPTTYPVAVGTGTDPGTLGQSFWVYYLHGPNGFDWATMSLVRRLVTVN